MADPTGFVAAAALEVARLAPEALLARSHALVAARLTKKQRCGLGLLDASKEPSDARSL